jgi:hypothetical protein
VKPGGRADHPVELLSGSLDRELGPAEESALEAHLEGCAECRGLLADFQRLDQAMANEPVAAIPAGLRNRILENLPPRTVIAAPPWWKQAMPLAVAASLVMAVLLWLGRPDRVPPLSRSATAKPEASPMLQSAPAMAPGSPASADATVAGNEDKPRTDRPARDKSKGTPSAPAGGGSEDPAPVMSEANLPPEPVPDSAAPPVSAEPLIESAPAAEPAPAAAPAPIALPAPAAPPPLGPSRPLPPQAEPTLQKAPDSGALKVERDAAKAKASAPPAVVDGDLAERLRSLGSLGNNDDVSMRAPGTSPTETSAYRPEIAGSDPAAGRLPTTPGDAGPAFSLFAAPYRVRLDAGRRMSVVVGAFSCVVTIQESDAKTIDAALLESRRALKTPGAVERDPDGTRILPATPAARDTILRLVRERYRRLLQSNCGPLPE